MLNSWLPQNRNLSTTCCCRGFHRTAEQAAPHVPGGRGAAAPGLFARCPLPPLAAVLH